MVLPCKILLQRIHRTLTKIAQRTFPSIYMAISGTLAVRDRCGILGNVYSHVTIPIKPGGLSTISFYSTYLIAGPGPSTFGSFDPALPASCRTYGAADPVWTTETKPLSNTTTTKSTSYLTVGPPFWPILSPPVELLEYDPQWKARCTRWDTEGADFAFYQGIFDPVSYGKFSPLFFRSNLLLFDSPVC